MYSFDWLIDPIAPETFFRDYYERKPLLIEGQDPGKFSTLLSIEAIDRYLANASASYPHVFLVDASRELKPDDFSFPDAGGRLDLPRVYQLFHSGATISLSQLNEHLPELAALCRVAEHAFSQHFQTNIYLSPRNAQGFKTHYDSHDVFVLQVAGSKQWTLYDTLIELPLHGQGFDPDKHVAGAATREFTVKAGDLFYCPRGLFHSARATDDISLHITLGVMGKTWADIMVEAISEACLASPAFRANLPVGFANPGFDMQKAEATFRSLIEAFARNASLNPILERFAESFVTSRRPTFEGCLTELDSQQDVSLESRLVARPHLLHLLREADENVTVLFGSTQITLPSFTRDALALALSGAPFQVSDLPGPIDDAGKIVLARRLIREGMLVRAGDTAASAAARRPSAMAGNGELASEGAPAAAGL